MTIGFNSLPRDLYVYLASFLPVDSLARLGACSKTLQAICDTESLWDQLRIKMHLPPIHTGSCRQQVIQAFIKKTIDTTRVKMVADRMINKDLEWARKFASEIQDPELKERTLSQITSGTLPAMSDQELEEAAAACAKDGYFSRAHELADKIKEPAKQSQVRQSVVYSTSSFYTIEDDYLG